MLAFAAHAALPLRVCAPLNQTSSPPPLATRRPAPVAMTSSSASSDLVVIGAGVLGSRVAKLWRALHPDASIVGETGSDRTHGALSAAGITPALSGAGGSAMRTVFCVPPGGFDDYAAAVAAAARRVPDGGRLVFTSSSSVHGAVARVREDSAYATSARAARLAGAERAALAVPRGMVVRLSGLYTVERGPHPFWIRAGKVGGGADGQLNMLHYDDAARAVVAALRLGDDAVDGLGERRMFLAAVRDMVSRKALLEASLRHPLYSDGQMPVFEAPAGAGDAKGERVYDSSWTRETLGWTPQWESFVDFMDADAKTAAATSG